MLSTCELRKLMFPWVAVLRDHVDLGRWYDGATSQGENVVWLRIPSSSSEVIDACVFDGLELLALLGQIDFVAWRMTLGSAWPQQASGWIEAANGRALQLGLDVSCSLSSHDQAIIQSLVIKNIEQVRSTEYRRARCVLENEYSQLEQSSVYKNLKPISRRSLQIRIRLRLTEGSLEKRLFQLLQLVSLQHTRQCSSARIPKTSLWEPLMTVTEAVAGLEEESMSPEACIHATTIVGMGVHLDVVSCADIRVTLDTAQLFIASLQCLAAVSNLKLESQGTLRRFICPQVLHRQTITAVYSALAVSASISSVSIPNPNVLDPEEGGSNAADRSFVWKWVAMALFSDDASNRIEHAKIDVQDLSTEHVEAMESVLRSDDCLAAVCRDLLEGSRSCMIGDKQYVCTSLFYLVRPRVEVPLGVVKTVNTRPRTVRVLGSCPDGFLNVLLPGWGVAWVNADDSPYTQPRLDRRTSVVHLTLSKISPASTFPALELVCLVGQRLSQLELDTHLLWNLPHGWLTRMLVACPRLVTLLLSMTQIRSLDVIAQAYRESCTRLGTLDVRISRTLLADELCSFFTTLATHDHPMACHLSELRLAVTHLRDAQGEVVQALETMLVANQAIHKFTLRAVVDTDVPAHEFPTRRAFERFNTPIAQRSLPLSLRNKLAFLSVVQPGYGAGEPVCGVERSALLAFDTRVISLVFEFAAKCRNRQVKVELRKRRERLHGLDG